MKITLELVKAITKRVSDAGSCIDKYFETESANELVEAKDNINNALQMLVAAQYKLGEKGESNPEIHDGKT